MRISRRGAKDCSPRDTSDCTRCAASSRQRHAIEVKLRHRTRATATTMSELHRTLLELHQELQRADRLAPEDRVLLQTLLGDIRTLLDSPPGATGDRPAPARQHGAALEGAAVKLEAGHPTVAS